MGNYIFLKGNKAYFKTNKNSCILTFRKRTQILISVMINVQPQFQNAIKSRICDLFILFNFYLIDKSTKKVFTDQRKCIL